MPHVVPMWSHSGMCATCSGTPASLGPTPASLGPTLHAEPAPERPRWGIVCGLGPNQLEQVPHVHVPG